ncbi:AAA domain-containing protein, partial [Methanobacterium formicicum]|uniref:AAA domain-containing protein n=1 Tax=Methanobacterium formicicum TaxID=2162 RepID=UPI00249081ED
MNEIFQKPANVQKLVAEIKEFIEEKREPDEIVNAMVTAISKNDNTITLELEEDFNFYPGALVTVNKIGGTVQDKYSNVIKVATKEKVKFEEGNTVKIDSSLMNLVLARLERTIDRIKDNKLDQNHKKILQFILGNGKPHYHDKNIVFQSKTLNESQKEAVNRSLNADNFHLVIGPPGTGKTFVITEILNQLLLKQKKILVTAWTNIAVDNILDKFHSYPEDKILRLGSFKEISPSHRKYTLEVKRKKTKAWDEVQQLERLIANQTE